MYLGGMMEEEERQIFVSAVIDSGDGVQHDMRKECRSLQGRTGSLQNDDQVHRVATHLLPHCLQDEG